ncbi:MAG: alpha/beta hydrolase [Phaeodactylibacter sp.]|nr:alpha/beta hydrolase [Phaeodactylibacter sp.]
MQYPVGYHRFHKKKFYNYQLNRWYALGYARKEDIEAAAAGIHSFEDYIQAFSEAAEVAVRENRLKNAASYKRASEFLIAPEDARKLPVYRAYRELFDQAFVEEPFTRHQVPYGDSYLSALKLPSRTGEVKGTLIGIPGFDAFIEEFYSIWDFFTWQGYDVIAYEGPGQGGTLRLHGLPFDHDWEKPTAAVLDYFKLDEVAALGVSMGGYWILRAAAFEKRITRVISMPPVYDWLEMTNGLNRALARWFVKQRKITNFFVRLKMGVDPLRHAVHNALFIQQKNEPYETVRWMMGMNKEHLHSHLVDQEVLLLGGEHDAFQPPILLEKQKKALVNAASVTTRIFTKAESADQHCQMGNLGLVLQSMVDWLDTGEIDKDQGA